MRSFIRLIISRLTIGLGIVYTPNEIVEFMVKATDYLLDKHFDKSLQDRHVKILDPCTGTGTFITSIIQHIPRHYLQYKYKEEIFANELSILSYYIANLNIEYTYYEKMDRYVEFRNIVFADTLDNVDWLEYEGRQSDVFNNENTRRITRQNKQEISVIIGNPPYNATPEEVTMTKMLIEIIHLIWTKELKRHSSKESRAT